MNVVKMGDKVIDQITGFKGIATGRSEYLNGCVQIMVTAEGLYEGKPIESQWFDEQRVDPGSVATAGGPQPAPPGQAQAHLSHLR